MRKNVSNYTQIDKESVSKFISKYMILMEGWKEIEYYGRRVYFNSEKDEILKFRWKRRRLIADCIFLMETCPSPRERKSHYNKAVFYISRLRDSKGRRIFKERVC